MFEAKPDLLNMKGLELKSQSDDFGKNGKTIFDTVDEMITSNYSSPEAVKIANEIRNYQDDLIEMEKTIYNYGEFCEIAGRKVIKNQENIMSEIQ